MSERDPVQAVAAAWTGKRAPLCVWAQQYHEYIRSKNVSQSLAAHEDLGGEGRALALTVELGGVC